MAERRRLFLTGSERAEFEHVHGPLVVDRSDPRFVLVTEEEEAKIAAFPPGVPVRQGQHPQDIAAVRAAELETFKDADVDSEFVGEEAQGKGALEAKPLDVEPAADAAGDDSAGAAGKSKDTKKK